MRIEINIPLNCSEEILHLKKWEIVKENKAKKCDI